MVTGVSYDFYQMSISLVLLSESTQWWQNMAIVVIFGLGVVTFLTLVVVPVLYSLLATMSERIGSIAARIIKLYWKPIERIM